MKNLLSNFKVIVQKKGCYLMAFVQSIQKIVKKRIFVQRSSPYEI